MPKVPGKRPAKRSQPKGRQAPTMRMFADRLECLRQDAESVRNKIRDLWEVLYTTGIEDVGPIEDKDDTPF